MLSTSTHKYAHCTARKAQRVADLIRGKRAGEAMVALRFMPYRAAKIVEKVLKSAMANAEQKQAVDAEGLLVSRVYADQGPTMKRIRARAQGRAFVIRKRMSHITVELSEAGGKANR